MFCVIPREPWRLKNLFRHEILQSPRLPHDDMQESVKSNLCLRVLGASAFQIVFPRLRRAMVVWLRLEAALYDNIVKT